MSSTFRRPIAERAARQISFWKAFAVQRRVVAALMVREALARFGHENLGFFWILGEPMVLTFGVMVMWSFSGMTHGEGISVIPFALTGYSMLTLWRHVVNGASRTLRNHAGLLFHRNIRFLDILISRCVLESLGGLAAFFIAYLPFNLLGYIDTIEDPLLVIGGWFFMTWLAFGSSMVVAGVTELFEAAEQFVPPLLYITLPLTGAFYMIHWLPLELQKVVWWSPLVQVFEMYRAGMFGSKVPTEWDVGYLTLWCIFNTALGLTIIGKAQKHIKIH